MPAGRKARWPERSVWHWPDRAVIPKASSTIPGSATAPRARRPPDIGRALHLYRIACLVQGGAAAGRLARACMSCRPSDARRPSRGEQGGKIEASARDDQRASRGPSRSVLVGDVARFGTEPGNKGAAKEVAGKKPVQIAPGDAPIGADAALRPAAETQHRPFKARTSGRAEMHLVAGDRHSGRELDAGRPRRAAFRRRAQCRRRGARGPAASRTPFHAERIGDRPAEHLVAAADPENPPALAAMGQNDRCPTPRAAGIRGR